MATGRAPWSVSPFTPRVQLQESIKGPEPVEGFKASLFNMSSREGMDAFLLVNTMTGGIMRVTETTPSDIHTALLDSGAPFDLVTDERTRDLLVSSGFLVRRDFDEMAWLEELHWRSRYGRRALAVGVAVTLACNFRCTYCYQKHQSRNLSPQLEDAIFAYASRNIEGRDSLRAGWFGGEPLLRLDTILRLGARLRRLAHEHDAKYEASLTTNGYLLKREVSAALSDAGVTSVQITLDGPPAIHDSRRVTKNGGPTFDVIASNLVDASSKFRHITLRVNIDKGNRDSMDELLDALRPIGSAVELAVRPTTAPDSPTGEADWCIRPEEYRRIDERLAEKAHRTGLRMLKGFAVPGTSYCSGYQLNSMTFDPFGDVHLCPICVGRRNVRLGVLSPAGNIMGEGGIQHAWRKWSPFQDDECRACKALPVCMGGCLWYVNSNHLTHRCGLRYRLVENFVRDCVLGTGFASPSHQGKEVMNRA